MKHLIALPAFYVVSRAPQLGSLLVAAGLAGLLPRGGQPLISGLLVLAIALLGSLAVRLACALPLLVTATGARRTPVDACWQAADEIGDWAGWESAPPST
ncbi:hypothetical protein ACN6LF_001377 [[Kitasatospora] papulosa]|uniref:hypothetical protein n=1 Tax=[Kitasatospora] papulosa TaxID=1464011 RepID=UPI00403C5959